MIMQAQVSFVNCALKPKPSFEKYAFDWPRSRTARLTKILRAGLVVIGIPPCRLGSKTRRTEAVRGDIRGIFFWGRCLSALLDGQAELLDVGGIGGGRVEAA